MLGSPATWEGILVIVANAWRAREGRGTGSALWAGPEYFDDGVLLVLQYTRLHHLFSMNDGHEHVPA